MELVIGDKLYSTWSLRPWLVLKRCGADFTETVVRLNQPDTAEQIALHSPAGRVPVLKVDGETIWDSLSISVWCAERYPEARLWPADAPARWQARSVTCEMHSGFMALRTECGMGPDHSMVGPDRSPSPDSEAVAADIRRLVQIFVEARGRFGAGGEYLYGEWSIADVFTPVAARVRHYQIDLAAHGDVDGVARAYVESLLAQPDFVEWSEQALANAA
jgi:glutathione S-transferase